MVFWFSVYFLRIFAKIYHRGSANGLENLPRKGAFIGALNHSSNMDVIAMSLIINRKAYTMAKDTLFKVPILKWWLKAVHMFPVIRDSSDHRAFNRAVKLLNNGQAFFIAPEGTRKKIDGQKPRARTGFVRLAQIANCPIIPIAIHGTDKVLLPGAWFPRPAKIQVKVGEPVQLEKIELKKENKELLQGQADMIMSKIYKMYEEFDSSK